jgi:hypothetical protein
LYTAGYHELYTFEPLCQAAWCCEDIEEIQTDLQDVMKTLMQNDFQQCFQSWKSCWDHFINIEGDKFEGVGGK